MKKKTPVQKVRIVMCPTGTMRLFDPKRKEYHTMHRMAMYFDTREECHWNDMIVLSGTKLFKRLQKLKKFPNMVFLAKDQDTDRTFPVKVGRAGEMRDSRYLSYAVWPRSKVISITWVEISPLDMIEVLDKN